MPLRLRQALVGIALAVIGLTGASCVALGGVDRTTATIDKSVGTARNSSILLNIIRASRHEPLYFYSISRVSGNALEDFKLSLPAITEGPKQALAQKQYTFGLNGLDVLDSQQSGSFDVALLESKDFYTGMLTPLGLGEVDILLKQGFPRELVYRLVVRDVTFYGPSPTGVVGLQRVVNDPVTPSPAFEKFFDGAMTHGFTTESFMVKEAADAASDSGDTTAKAKAPQMVAHWRLCYDPALVDSAADPDALTDTQASGNQCGERPASQSEQVGDDQVEGLKETYEDCKKLDDARTAHPGAAVALAASSPANVQRVCAHLDHVLFAVQLDTRSLYGIFTYLGAALENNRDIQLKGLGSPLEAQTGRNASLMRIIKGRVTGCFASATLDGPYCIPSQGSDNLKMTFSIINALQALKTSPGDLPVTTAVRVEQ